MSSPSISRNMRRSWSSPSRAWTRTTMASCHFLLLIFIFCWHGLMFLEWIFLVCSCVDRTHRLYGDQAVSCWSGPEHHQRGGGEDPSEVFANTLWHIMTMHKWKMVLVVASIENMIHVRSWGGTSAMMSQMSAAAPLASLKSLHDCNANCHLAKITFTGWLCLFDEESFWLN